MIKKLVFLLFVITQLITACNKGFNEEHGGAASKSVTLNVSSATSFNIAVFITRSTTSEGTLQIENATANPASNPYSFSSSKAQVGDKISIQVNSFSNQPITAALNIGGVDIPATSTGIDSKSKSYVLWDTTIAK